MPRFLPMGQAELNGHASDRMACRDGAGGRLLPGSVRPRDRRRCKAEQLAGWLALGLVRPRFAPVIPRSTTRSWTYSGMSLGRTSSRSTGALAQGTRSARSVVSKLRPASAQSFSAGSAIRPLAGTATESRPSCPARVNRAVMPVPLTGKHLMAVDSGALIKTLNPTCLNALQAAAGLCPLPHA